MKPPVTDKPKESAFGQEELVSDELQDEDEQDDEFPESKDDQETHLAGTKNT